MYYNYIKYKAIYLGIEQLIKIRGKSLAKAPNCQLAVFLTIRRLYTDFLTGLSACLPACAYLPVHTCLYILEWLSSSSGNGRLVLAIVLSYLPTYLPTCLPVCVYVCICVWFNWEKGRPDWRLWSIRIVLYGCSLAVYSNGGCLGCLPRKPWFDFRYWSFSSIRSIDRLNRSWCSLAGYSNGHRLVLRRSSSSGNGCLVLVTVV